MDGNFASDMGWNRENAMQIPSLPGADSEGGVRLLAAQNQRESLLQLPGGLSAIPTPLPTSGPLQQPSRPQDMPNLLPAGPFQSLGPTFNFPPASGAGQANASNQSSEITNPIIPSFVQPSQTNDPFIVPGAPVGPHPPNVPEGIIFPTGHPNMLHSGSEWLGGSYQIPGAQMATRSVFPRHVDHWLEPSTTYPHSMDYDPMRYLSYPARLGSAQDSRAIAYPHRFPSEMSYYAQRVYDQITSRVSGVVDAVAERQVRMDEVLKGIAEQQSKSSTSVQNVISQQEVMSQALKTVADQQGKADIAVQSVVEKQTAMSERQARSDSMLHTILSQQTEMLSAITKLHHLNMDKPEVRTSGSHDRIASHPQSGPHSSVSSETCQPSAPTSRDVTTTASVLIDEWLDGPFEQTFTNEQLDAASAATGRRRVDVLFNHWAMADPGGIRSPGSKDAATPELGKFSKRVCLGVIACASGTCEWTARPQTRKAGRERQLTATCNCGDLAAHFPCDVVHEFRSFKDGISFKSTGHHNHPRPPKLHLSKAEARALAKLSKLNPKATPSAFIMGVPDPDGEFTTVQDISDILINRDRLAYEINKENKKKMKEEGLFGRFTEFVRTHPDFVVAKTIEDIVVITVQTDFMATQILRSMSGAKFSEPVNGTVSDAAHKYFREVNSVLMATTLYCPVVCRWMAAIMSYMNGQTIAHYKCHFLTYIRIVHRICVEKNIPFTDKLFLMVLDFSEAERQGFIAAFVEFVSGLDTDSRTPDELRAAAEKLLKGCSQHFDAQKTRIRKTKALVPSGHEERFDALIDVLLKVPTVREFEKGCDDIINAFPAVFKWLEWWKRPKVAKLIFPAFRDMDDATWQSLPKTTNAEESLHFSVYKGVGQGHDVIEGLKGLYRYANSMQCLYTAVRCGLRIRNGKAEPWKFFVDKYGTTHPSRTKESIERRIRAVNDGRPPDTVRKLLVRRVLPADVDELATLLKGRQLSELASYRYKDNSCWLDTSLELLFRVVERDPLAFEGRLSAIDTDSPLYNLHELVQTRLSNLEGEPSQIYITTTNDLCRDSFRKGLLDNKIITSLKEQDSLFLWLTQACYRKRRSKPTITYAAETYFFAHEVVIRYCAGVDKKCHMCLTKTPAIKNHIDLSIEAHSKHNGRVVAYVKDLFRVRKEAINVRKCWKTTCNSGDKDVQLFSALVSHPICLRIGLPRPYREVPDPNSDVTTPSRVEPVPFDEELLWDFPTVIDLPGIDEHGKRTTCHYDVVGRAVHSEERSHFFAYVTDPLKRCYMYDDMLKEGVLTKTASGKHVKNIVAGQHKPTRDQRTIVVVYHLREGEQGQDQLLRWTQSELLAVHNIAMTAPSSDTYAPQLTPANDSWRELRLSGELGGQAGSLESEMTEYEYEGQSMDVFPNVAKRSLEQDSDYDDRPRKRARFLPTSDDLDDDLTISSKKRHGNSSSPVKTPTPRTRKRPKGISPQKSTPGTPTPAPKARDKVHISSPVKSISSRAPDSAKETAKEPRVRGRKALNTTRHIIRGRSAAEPIKSMQSSWVPGSRITRSTAKQQTNAATVIQTRSTTKDAIVPKKEITDKRTKADESAASYHHSPPHASRPVDHDLLGSEGAVVRKKPNRTTKFDGKRSQITLSRMADILKSVEDELKSYDEELESEERDRKDTDVDADGSTDEEALAKQSREAGLQPSVLEEAQIVRPTLKNGTDDTIPDLRKEKQRTKRALEKVQEAEEGKTRDDDEGPIQINCRCGIVETRTPLGTEGLDQDVIQCSECLCWSHQACQFRGYTAFIRPKDRFFCEVCRVGKPDMKLVEKQLRRDLRGGIPIEKRIRPGLGVLVRIREKYWYPGRVIDCPAWDAKDQIYTIKMWRLCCGSVDVPRIVRVGIELIRDELWQDFEARRQIRLGVFQPAGDVDLPVSDFRYVKGTGDMDTILASSWKDLCALARFSIPDKDNHMFPVLKHFESLNRRRKNSKDPMQTFLNNWQLMDTGCLPADDYIHVAGWLYERLTGADSDGLGKMEVMDWFMKPVHSHALTLVVAYRLKTKTLQDAFEILVNTGRRAVDVDRECISFLEERMFEVSERAGRASHYVWGLGAGAHENCWLPWDSAPTSWSILQEDFPSEDLRKSDGYSVGSYRKRAQNPNKPKPRLRITKSNAIT